MEFIEEIRRAVLELIRQFIQTLAQDFIRILEAFRKRDCGSSTLNDTRSNLRNIAGVVASLTESELDMLR